MHKLNLTQIQLWLALYAMTKNPESCRAESISVGEYPCRRVDPLHKINLARSLA